MLVQWCICANVDGEMYSSSCLSLLAQVFFLTIHDSSSSGDPAERNMHMDSTEGHGVKGHSDPRAEGQPDAANLPVPELRTCEHFQRE